MKKVSALLSLVLVLGMLVGRPLLALAEEHGGQEHGGAATAPSADDQLATLNEAAAALESTDAALAAELKAWAEGAGTGDQKATLNKAAAALEFTNAALSSKLKAMAGA